MKVKLVFHGNLKKYNNDLPEVKLDIKSETTVEQLIHQVRIPEREISFVAVNGSRVSNCYILREDDVIKLFQLVGGG